MVSLIANPRSAEKMKILQMPYIMSVKSACLVLFTPLNHVLFVYMFWFLGEVVVFFACVLLNNFCSTVIQVRRIL